jgi:hypothetical protein
MLVTERGMLRGDEAAGNEFVLQELRRTIRAAGQTVLRIGDAARLFFAPLEPFLIDDGADHKRVGRLARVSLEPIWEWICRDLMPAEAKALCDDINRALVADDGQGRVADARAARTSDPAHQGNDRRSSRGRRENAPAPGRAGRHTARLRGCRLAAAHPRTARRAWRPGAPVAEALAHVRARADRPSEGAGRGCGGAKITGPRRAQDGYFCLRAGPGQRQAGAPLAAHPPRDARGGKR